MATCKDCINYTECCNSFLEDFCMVLDPERAICGIFRDRSRFVELPCKVGDTVYIIARISGKEEIIQDSVESLTISFFVDNTPIILFDGIKTCDWDSSDFGKRVFLTKEQAEQALKEREKNGKC